LELAETLELYESKIIEQEREIEELKSELLQSEEKARILMRLGSQLSK
jgi:hypothetical protein